MSKIILVTGGARSGKSSYAEALCKAQNNQTAYIATSIPFDEEMKERVRKHQEMRPSEWTTYEIYENIAGQIEEIAKEYQTVILDCVTLMVNNLMFKENLDYDKLSEEEVNKLEWVDINDNFFDMNKYAGEGNIGHIIEEIKIDMSKDF